MTRVRRFAALGCLVGTYWLAVAGEARADEETSDAKALPHAEAEPAQPSQPSDAASPPTVPSDPPPADTPPHAPAANPPADQGDVVVVPGTRLRHTAGSVHVVRTDQLERFKYDDPQAMLAPVPGVYARGEDGMGLRPNIGIRGVNPDRSKKLTLLEDGIPFAPAPYSASAAYYFPLITRMTQVRVIKGPAAIAHGPQTVGGAIDLITRPVPIGTAGGLDLAGGEYGYGKLHGWVGSGDERIGFLVEGVHLRNDGFKELPNGADTGAIRNEFMFKGTYVVDPRASSRQEFRLKATYSDETSNETYLGLSDADFRANPNQRYAASQLDHMHWHRTAVSLAHVFEPSEKFSITTTVYRSDLARTWRKLNQFRGASVFDTLTTDSARSGVYRAVLRGQADATANEMLLIGPNQRDFVVHGVESRARWNTSTGPVSHKVEYGLRLHHDSIERRHSEDAFAMTGGQLVPEASPTVVTALNGASTDAVAGHALDVITWHGLSVTPGLRIEAMRSTFVDRVTKATQNRLTQVVLPGAGAFYALTPDVGALAGAYRGFSPPTPGSSAAPELSVNYEAGARYMRGRGRVELIGFYNDYSNLTDVCTLSSGCIDTNLDRQFDAGKARIYGLEAFAEHALRVGPVRIPLSASYTLTHAEFLRDFQSEDPIYGNVLKGDEMPYIPRHQANVMAGVESDRAGGAATMTYVSPMRELAGNRPISETLATDEQVIVDLSGYVVVYRGVRLYANIRNLFDEQYIVSRRPYGARPNAPRWVQVGVKLSF